MVKFILLTEPQALDLKELLRKIYEHYTNYVTKNPLYKINEPLYDCTLFIQHLDNEIKDWKPPTTR
jgi:hypothetical protein